MLQLLAGKLNFKCVMKRCTEMNAETVHIVFRIVALPPALNWALVFLIIKEVLAVLRVVKSVPQIDLFN